MNKLEELIGKKTVEFYEATYTMESNIHLFTKVEDGLPDGIMITLIIVNGFSIFGIYQGCGKWVNEIGLDKKPTHWLDLSKLTTKANAKELMEECIDTVSGYVNEWQDSCGPERIQALKEVFDKL